MSSTISPAAWLQTALYPAVHPAANPSDRGGRHRAEDEAARIEPLTSEQIARVGRHAAPDDHTTAVPAVPAQRDSRERRDSRDVFEVFGFEY